MNYVIFNKDGSLFYKSITEIINQNSDGVNKFFVSIIGYDVSTWGCSAVFRLPNGTSSEKSASTTATTEKVNGVSYTGYVITLSAIETTYAGNLLMSIMCYNSTTKGTLWSYPVYLTVNETIADSEAPITNAEYATLLTEIAGKLPKSGGSANPMTGDLYLGGHSIYNADEIAVMSLVANDDEIINVFNDFDMNGFAIYGADQVIATSANFDSLKATNIYATTIYQNNKKVATEEEVNTKVSKSGDTMSGSLDMSGNNVSAVNVLNVDQISTYTGSLVSFVEGLTTPTLKTPQIQSDTGTIISYSDINLNGNDLKGIKNVYGSGDTITVNSKIYIPYSYETTISQLVANTLEVHAPAKFGGDVSVSGDVSVRGNLTKKGVDVATVDDLKTIKQNAFKIVDELPETGEEGIVYLVLKEEGSTTYTKWIWEGGTYHNIGDTDIDLSGYQKKLTAGDNITIKDDVISADCKVHDVTLDGTSVVEDNTAKLETGASAEAEAVEIEIGDGLKLENNVLSATGGSTVSVSQTLTSGTEIAGITIGGTETKLYAPTGGGSSDWTLLGSNMGQTSSKKFTIDGTYKHFAFIGNTLGFSMDNNLTGQLSIGFKSQTINVNVDFVPYETQIASKSQTFIAIEVIGYHIHIRSYGTTYKEFVIDNYNYGDITEITLTNDDEFDEGSFLYLYAKE